MLTEREERFAQAFAATGNGTAAARAAGYRGNENTLAANASRLRRKPDVADRIEELARRAAASADPREPELAPKLRAFVDAYLETGNGAEAARRAGYKGANAAHRLLGRADVREAIEVEKARREGDAIATTRELLEILTKIVRDEEIDPAVRVRAASTLVGIQRAHALANPSGKAPEPDRKPRIVIVRNGRGPMKPPPVRT